MENSLTLRAWSSRSVSPRFAGVTARRLPPTEGFGLVRRPDRDDDDLVRPISPAQAEALHALVNARRSSASGGRWTRRDRGIDVVWAGTLAVLLTLAVVSLGSGRTFVATADHLHAIATTRASAVTASAKQQPVTRELVTRQPVTRQSSAATSRTM